MAFTHLQIFSHNELFKVVVQLINNISLQGCYCKSFHFPQEHFPIQNFAINLDYHIIKSVVLFSSSWLL